MKDLYQFLMSVAGRIENCSEIRISCTKEVATVSVYYHCGNVFNQTITSEMIRTVKDPSYLIDNLINEANNAVIRND